MQKKYEEELRTDQLLALRDEDIDFSDIPELDPEYFEGATLERPEGKLITLRLSKETLDFFRKNDDEVEARIEALLEGYVKKMGDQTGLT